MYFFLDCIYQLEVINHLYMYLHTYVSIVGTCRSQGETKAASKDFADTRGSNKDFEIAGLRRANNWRWCDRSRMRSGCLHTRYDYWIVFFTRSSKATFSFLFFEGLKTALVEADDFASGTSSRSTKLIHGGVRYLQKAIMQVDIEQYRMVKEALHERASMLQSAPHLAHPLPIMLPVYTYVLMH